MREDGWTLGCYEVRLLLSIFFGAHEIRRSKNEMFCYYRSSVKPLSIENRHSHHFQVTIYRSQRLMSIRPLARNPVGLISDLFIMTDGERWILIPYGRRPCHLNIADMLLSYRLPSTSYPRSAVLSGSLSQDQAPYSLCIGETHLNVNKLILPAPRDAAQF